MNGLYPIFTEITKAHDNGPLSNFHAKQQIMEPTAPSSALVSLEWQKLLDFTETEAATATGRAIVQSWFEPAQWAQTLTEARTRQSETDEVTPLLHLDSLWGPLMDLVDPTESLERLGMGSVLEITDLCILRSWLNAIQAWTQVSLETIEGERFKKALGRLPDPKIPLGALDRVLTADGEVSEKASPKLYSIHQEIRSLKKEIHVILDHLLKTLATRGVLQENFSDVRDGRYVVPVKISNQNDVEGIVYEASASRQTVFVEPKEVGALNNRLRQKQNELIQEIFIILQEVSLKIRPFGSDIHMSSLIISHWDAVQARARIGKKFGGKVISVTDERTFSLSSTAHPLLWWALPVEKIIRNHLVFGDPTRTLLLTGPNTGGKTVLLKTLGLAGISARTGFPFPAVESPQVPFFDTFFIDLGDPQSIEQHLSSFSGHIRRFKDILTRVTDQSLVLIDELNSATDPEEGAALGRAILETLMARGAMIVATTHDPHLKALAVSDQRILNASMEFDESCREPTYTMILGVPGRSRALETAERLGIPPEVLVLARTYLSKEHLHFEGLLSKLESDVAGAAQARSEAAAIKDEALKIKKDWLAKTENKTQEMLERTQQRLKRILEQAQESVRASVRKLDDLKSRKDLDQARADLNQTLGQASRDIQSSLEEEAPEIARALQSKLEPQTIPPPELIFQVGESVRIPKWKCTGVILSLLDKRAKVSMGALQMILPFSELEKLTSTERKKLTQNQRTARVRQEERPDAPPGRIDLRGLRLDEALSQLEHYLDLAYRSGGPLEVTVVHGLGTGAIREGARKLIESLPYIKSYRDGGTGQGGAGATLVEFDR